MKTKSAPPQITPNMLLLGIFLVILSFFMGFKYRGKHMGMKDDRIKMILAIDSLSEDSYTFPKSNLEWITATIGLAPKGFTQSSIVTTTVAGTVTEQNEATGAIDIASRHYYVGTPGKYQYSGSLGLTSADDVTRTFFFSPRRMQEVSVFTVRNGKQTPINFADIKPGDQVEVEESVDLSRSNINDQNLISLTIRILK